jgi:hypothetical protein
MNLPQAKIAENDEDNNDGSDQPDDAIHGRYPLFLKTQRRTSEVTVSHRKSHRPGEAYCA